MKFSDPIDLHATVDLQYKQILQQEKEIENLKSELAQEKRLHNSARTSATLATIAFVFCIFLAAWGAAGKNSYKEELDQLKEEYSDNECSYEESISDADDKYSELSTEYEDALSYSKYLESENQQLKEDLEYAQEVLDELESLGAFDYYGVYY